MQIDVANWDGFVSYIHGHMLDLPSYVWRGHRRDDWKLVATLYRERPEFRNDAGFANHQRHLRAFQYAVRGRRGNNPPRIKKENDWWALGQAHGLETPLLDWTASPFAASFFAFNEKGADEDRTSNRVVYALNRVFIGTRWVENRRNQVRDHLRVAREAAEREEQEPEPTSPPLSLRPAMREREIRRQVIAEMAAKSGEKDRTRKQMERDNPRMSFVRPLTDDNARLINQAGLFTRTPEGEDIETFVRRMFTGEVKMVLIRVSIPDSDDERAIALLALNRMNINHLTLFPDLYGAGAFCNLGLDVGEYSDLGELDISDFSDLEP